ncbi:MAG: MgtC/SapB family protein [Nanoarchaeota archaeon]|nr:MgtC/SapB family protein [Nanoarchaeota archaeon]MCG2718200.1 MgtC/SapB family protein [Nanoarchaeota archaeon]
MRLPRTFRPEKNLEEKTEQLLNDPKIHVKPKPAVKGKYLNNLFDYLHEPLFMVSYVHEKVDILIDRSDYQVVPRSSKCNQDYTHWYKQDPLSSDSFYVLSRRNEASNSSSFFLNPFQLKGYYSFARPTQNNLENFCQMFEKYNEWDSNRANDYGWNRWKIKSRLFFGMIGLGAIIGAGTGFVIAGLTTTITLSAIMGMQVSLVSNIFLEKHVFNLYKKIDTKRFNNYEIQLRKIADDIITDDEVALRRAFS